VTNVPELMNNVKNYTAGYHLILKIGGVVGILARKIARIARLPIKKADNLMVRKAIILPKP
jgi:hypothetical protein